MRARFVLGVFLLAAPLAAATVGTGSAVAVAGGSGADILIWRDGAAVKAILFTASGTPVQSAPIVLPFASGGDPAAAWDGSGFVIAWRPEPNSIAIVRLPVSGGSSFAMTIPAYSGPWSISAASLEQGSTLLAWEEREDVFTVAVGADGELGSVHEVDLGRGGDPRIARSGSEYLLVSSVVSCRTELCDLEEILIQRLGADGVPIAPRAGWPFSEYQHFGWFLLGGERPLLAIPALGTPPVTTLVSIEPRRNEAATRLIRFPDWLRAQETAHGRALLGLGARIDVSDTGAPLTVNWAPLPEGMRLAGVLPSSGARVFAPSSGAGTISVEMPATDVSEVGLAPVFISPGSVWLKVDNRGPDAARTIDVWLTGRVQSISSLVNGTITHHGALSRIRFQPTLKQGAGFEIAIWFEQPIDATAFEAWALALGTDRDATNNYVTTRAPEPEPPQPRRRRVVRR